MDDKSARVVFALMEQWSSNYSSCFYREFFILLSRETTDSAV